MEYWGKYPGMDNIRVSIMGEIEKYYKRKGWKKVAQYYKKRRSSGKFCKVNNKELNVARMVYRTFIGEIEEGYVIEHIDGNKSINMLENLRKSKPIDILRKNGGKHNARKVEKINKKGELIDTYDSVRAAGRDNYLSYQAVADRCEGKVKRPFELCDFTFRYQD